MAIGIHRAQGLGLQLPKNGRHLRLFGQYDLGGITSRHHRRSKCSRKDFHVYGRLWPSSWGCLTELQRWAPRRR
eukprot:9668686-Lingulodinium_polyedra.AAC.1